MNNANKIDIIICGNNKLYLDEQKKYIENLIIPDGMQLNILVVEGAKSMTSGYNEGIANSDAKYKIYMQNIDCGWIPHIELWNLQNYIE